VKKVRAKKTTPRVDPALAEAAVEVLQAVWLHENNFELEHEIVQDAGQLVVTQDAEEHLWVTVRVHVPRLDIDMWLDGTHPANTTEDDDE